MIPLEHLEVIAIDAQASGASPRHGHVIELGWGVASAADCTQPVSASLVALPDGEELPKRVARLTGIDAGELAAAPEVETVWRTLVESAPQSGPDGKPVAVIHYATFERPFLHAADASTFGERSFPFEVICTHALARRLLPDLPRCGIRALAGYFGDPLPADRRAATHVEATLRIWAHLVERLDEVGVMSLAGLYELLREPRPRTRRRNGFRLPRETRLALPDVPGVYRMLARNGAVLYVGKATSLRDRVNSYFRSRKPGSRNTLEMLTQVWDLDVTETATALEAALLENDEIKRLAPPYNVALQAEERSLVYMDRDWRPNETWSETHRLGPLPDDGTWTAMRALRRLCAGRAPDEEDVEALLYQPPDSLDEAFGDALEVFSERFGRRLPTPTAVVRRGLAWQREAAAHAEALAAEEAARAAATPEAPPDDTDAEASHPAAESEVVDFVWTAEAMAVAFEAWVRRASRRIRLARWMRGLANATIVWNGRGAVCGERWLQLRKGRVVHAAAGAPRDPTAPVSTGPLEADVCTYDRLRVLTTELRRLVAEDRAPRVWFTGGAPMEAADVERALRWL